MKFFGFASIVVTPEKTCVFLCISYTYTKNVCSFFFLLFSNFPLSFGFSHCGTSFLFCLGGGKKIVQKFQRRQKRPNLVPRNSFSLAFSSIAIVSTFPLLAVLHPMDQANPTTQHMVLQVVSWMKLENKIQQNLTFKKGNVYITSIPIICVRNRYVHTYSTYSTVYTYHVHSVTE